MPNNNNTDLFAPPTQEELNEHLYSPPSPEELKSTGPGLKEDVEDVARGLAQGASLGFSDEGLAALKAARDLVTSKKSLKEAPETYRKYQKEEQSKNEESQARSPYLYGGSQLLGALAPAALTSGLSGEASGALALKELAKRGGMKAVASELGSAAAGGALQGGVQAAGLSKGNLDTEEGRQKLLEETKSGAKWGAILNPIFRGFTGETPSKSVLEESPLKSQLKTAFQKGTEKLKYGDTLPVQERIVQETSKNVGEIAQQLANEGIEASPEQIQRLISTLRSSGPGSLRATGKLNSLLETIENPQTRQALKENIVKSADELAVAQKTIGVNALESPIKHLNPGIAGIPLVKQGHALQAANLMGRASVSRPAELSRQVFNMPAKALHGASQMLESSSVPGLAALGKTLREGIEQGDEFKKNAILFVLMQRPEARELLGISNEE